MKRYILVLSSLIFFSTLGANEITDTLQNKNKDKDKDKEHELYLTTYILSFHWTNNESTDEKYTNEHKAYGLEYVYKNDYSLTFNHFINSRGRDVDVYGAGYLFDFHDESFGLHLIGGYQEGYCFNGLLNSVQCTEGQDNTSAFILPMLYYKHQYFKLDLFTNTDMIAFRLNIKISDLFD